MGVPRGGFCYVSSRPISSVERTFGVQLVERDEYAFKYIKHTFCKASILSLLRDRQREAAFLFLSRLSLRFSRSSLDNYEK